MSSGTPHERTYTPPIPALEIGLQAPDDEQAIGPLVAVLDTGADISMVPLALLEQIKAPEQDEVRLRSHWGQATSFTTYIPPTPAAGLVVYPAGIVSRCKQPALPLFGQILPSGLPLLYGFFIINASFSEQMF